MSAVTRLWLGFAALGAGMIHVAVGASAPFPLSVLLIGFGVAELAWGVTALALGRLPVPRAVSGAALIPVFVWGATAALGSGLGVSAEATGLPFYSMAIASLFNLFLAVVMAVHQRRRSNEAASSATGAASVARTGTSPAVAGGWRFVTALALGGAIFSGLTTPALAATDAGQLAVPHGTSHGGH
ncbi:hypothetical protein D6T64_16805 [Cryobacterium melibiosiphilum]|uniref:Uncharacterized protein n=1 Tax=Cryobacterium melibiosiphilum TaxID=995039 RepID=A0A3A5MAD7_9MICO|nr:hypothetical protein [Cryobacterium melibiosiphilum]RJT87090.1 hypothetical protein D6T64_16805 [Cryobacterium melibiosiphilum]